MKTLARILLASTTALALAGSPVAVHAQSAPAAEMAVTSGMAVTQTTKLSKLTIAEGATLSAPEGKSLTLTVDGVEKTIAPGTYTGDVVLTVTDEMPITYMDLAPEAFRSALYVKDNKIVPGQSVTPAVLGGTVTGTEATDLVLRSEGENFNGLILGGTTKYTLQSPRITMVGNGGNDFSGWGAAVMVTDDATLVMNDAQIDTYGAIRPATFVNKNGKLEVYDSRITVRNGKLPDDYVFSFKLGEMKEVPWQLGIVGNVRANVFVDRADVLFKRSYIKAEGWGALSIDAPQHVRMSIEDCYVETTDSGYGTFSIGDSIVTVKNTHFNVADMALIMAASGSAHITDGTVVDSRRFGVMMFTYPRAGTLKIDGGTVMNTASTGIQSKGTGGIVIIDDAVINPGNGILVQAMIDDNDRQPGVPREGYAYGTKTPADTALSVKLRNTTLAGDVINSRTTQGDLDLILEDAKLTGRVSNAEQSPAKGRLPSKAEFRLIGDVTNDFGPAKGDYGTHVTLDLGSTWEVTGTSYLDSLTILPGAKLTGKDGGKVTITIDGEEKDPNRPGSYVGKIVVTPA